MSRFRWQNSSVQTCAPLACPASDPIRLSQQWMSYGEMS